MTDAKGVAALLDYSWRAQRFAHRSVLDLLEDLSEEQIRKRPGRQAPSIGFHVWHLARWADHDSHRYDGSTQIWHRLALAEEWGLHGELGESDAGTEMDEDAAERFEPPSKADLVGYAKSAFEAADQLSGRLSSEGAQVTLQDARDDADEVTHVFRHLGMIEALRGVLGMPGSAIR